MEKAPAGIRNMEEVEKVFNRFDADGDGKISASELGNVVRALGSNVSDEELRSMIEEMDANQDGFVDLGEFTRFNRAGDGPVRGEEDIKDAFDIYDMDGNGLISVKELHLVLKKLGERCSSHDCSQMIDSVDSDGDGCVNYDEFKKMMRNDSGGERVAAKEVSSEN
ncbi:probable calcium-binding protein CML18 [Dendrobium catenatum]|uniref:Calcium-binding allergen Ole e 8 n=1 Tax=Dendrobium catenatum TaxID=906689 RepID=A0A2I0XAV9_9ASPA|nr:probable calcium-binding protein CML18 [Dendrobium catenatum]PKU85059.1 Calcium-binding allergen Ole e 8 [Dendrobium catenatum]